MKAILVYISKNISITNQDSAESLFLHRLEIKIIRRRVRKGKISLVYILREEELNINLKEFIGK